MMRSDVEKDLLGWNTQKAYSRRKRKAERAFRFRFGSKLLVKTAVVFFVTFAMYYLTSWALQPHLRAWLITKQIPELQQRKEAAIETRNGLRWKLRYALSNKGSSNMARDFGYYKPGEIPIKLPESELLNKKLPKPQPAEPSMRDRFMLAMCRFCRVDTEAYGVLKK